MRRHTNPRGHRARSRNSTASNSITAITAASTEEEVQRRSNPPEISNGPSRDGRSRAVLLEIQTAIRPEPYLMR